MSDPKPSFSGRRRARRYALQALYGWSVSQNPLADVETYTLSEHQHGEVDSAYFQILLHSIPTQLSILDKLFEPYLSRNLRDLGLIELTILRIAVYELKEHQEIPYRVVINEALELAKTFAAPDSHKFVNGILDKVRKDLRTLES